MNIFESQFSYLLKNLMRIKSLLYVNIKRFYEMCIVNAKYISMPALMQFSSLAIRSKLLEVSMGFDSAAS